MGVAAGTPTRSICLTADKTEDNRRHCIFIFMRKERPICAIFVAMDDRSDNNFEYVFIRTNLNGKIQRAFKTMPERDSDDKPIVGKALLTSFKPNDYSTKFALQYELDF
jgi:hypothetical protein